MAELTETQAYTGKRGVTGLWSNQKFQRGLITAVATFLCILGVVVIMFPVAWMISTSLKTEAAALQFPPQWIPKPAVWHNYWVALTSNPFGIYFKNSMLYAITVMVLQTLSSALAAYGFAKLRAPGKNLIFLFVLATLMLPYEVTLIPQYVMFAKMGWLDSYKPLIIPQIFGASYSIFLLRQFMRGIPRDYEEAALIDGASYFSIWWRIILPLSMPALGAVAIITFMWHYNNFMGPLLYINSRLLYPVQLGLQQFQAPHGGTEYNLLMAASLVTILPPVIVFYFAQRFFIQGIVISGVKG